MTNQVGWSVEGNRVRIALSGRFDFNAHREFRRVCEEAFQRTGVAALDVDLSAVSYIDSSALGMLLLLKDRAEVAKWDLQLIHTPPPVRHILEVANFHKLFTLR